jgi:methionyl aminopeptidase
MILKKTPDQIEKMRRSGSALGEVHMILADEVRAGVTTKQLDSLADALIRERGGVPSFLGYRGYPASICTSINEVVVHGIPGKRKLKDGDVLSLDVGLILDGWHSDRAITYAVGKISNEAKRLLGVTEESLAAAIQQCRPGRRLGDVSHAVESVVEAAGFSVVREYAGHQIGREMHEGGVWLPNFGPPGRGPVLEPGMVFAIEPMVNAGGFQTLLLDDGWTVVTADGSLSAHFEHTVAVTEDGPLVLTEPLAAGAFTKSNL